MSQPFGTIAALLHRYSPGLVSSVNAADHPQCGRIDSGSGKVAELEP